MLFEFFFTQFSTEYYGLWNDFFNSSFFALILSEYCYKTNFHKLYYDEFSKTLHKTQDY